MVGASERDNSAGAMQDTCAGAHGHTHTRTRTHLWCRSVQEGYSSRSTMFCAAAARTRRLCQSGACMWAGSSACSHATAVRAPLDVRRPHHVLRGQRQQGHGARASAGGVRMAQAPRGTRTPAPYGAGVHRHACLCSMCLYNTSRLYSNRTHVPCLCNTSRLCSTHVQPSLRTAPHQAVLDELHGFWLHPGRDKAGHVQPVCEAVRARDKQQDAAQRVGSLYWRPAVAPPASRTRTTRLGLWSSCRRSLMPWYTTLLGMPCLGML
jgi:hypothetical protein